MELALTILRGLAEVALESLTRFDVQTIDMLVFYRACVVIKDVGGPLRR